MQMDAYLDDLCHALTVDPLRRDEIRLEVHTHLRQRADALVREGMNREAAEARAVEEFGDPSETAARFSVAPVPPTMWNVSRHVDILSGLLLAGGLASLVSFLGWFVNTLFYEHQLTGPDLLRNLALGGGYA